MNVNCVSRTRESVSQTVREKTKKQLDFHHRTPKGSGTEGTGTLGTWGEGTADKRLVQSLRTMHVGAQNLSPDLLIPQPSRKLEV